MLLSPPEKCVGVWRTDPKCHPPRSIGNKWGRELDNLPLERVRIVSCKSAASRCFAPRREMVEQIDRKRKDHGRGPLARDVVQCREITQLHRPWLLRDDPAGLD